MGFALSALVLGGLLVPSGGATSHAPLGAKAWVEQHRAALGIDPRVELVERERFSTRFGVSVHFEARLDGVALDFGAVVVTLDLVQRVVLADSEVPAFATVQQAPLDSSALMELAAARVRGALRDARGILYGGLRPTWFEVSGTLYAGAWVRLFTARETDNFHVAVDAVSGAVLAVQNRQHRAANDAQVYATSPGGLDAGVGTTPTLSVRLEFADGGPMVTRDSGFLEGDALVAFNCCLERGCVPDAGARVAQNYAIGSDGGLQGRDGGEFETDGGAVFIVRSVVCDRVHRATNDVANHASGDFVYAPVDGPSPLEQAREENSDAFAEVHAFFHGSRFVEWVEGLSRGPPSVGAPFRLRESRKSPPLPMMLQTNFVQADFASDLSGACLLVGNCNWTRFGRVGNAMFVPRENYPTFRLPELYPDGDAVYYFQGPTLDFAYDATVVHHELGHAVIQSTAAIRFGHPRTEATWANDEGGAMHEGLADYLAAAFANDPDIGRYLGPNRDRTADGPLRSVAGNLTCPRGLEGTVHEDGRIFSQALWSGRVLFPSASRFDAAVYAALVAMTPSANFDTAALTVATMVGLAFSEDPAAAETMRWHLKGRGVTECSHLIAVEGAVFSVQNFGLTYRPLSSDRDFGDVPGPYQLRFERSVRGGSVEVQTATQDSFRVHLRRGAPVEFSYGDGGTVLDDASGYGDHFGTFVQIPCGDPAPIYVAISNGVQFPKLLTELTVRVNDDDRCPQPSVTLPRLSAQLPVHNVCGCGAAPGNLALLALLVIAVRRRK